MKSRRRRASRPVDQDSSNPPPAPVSPARATGTVAATVPSHAEFGPTASFAARRFWPGALLFLAVATVFLPALRDGFITYDDPVYVTENPHVTTGLTWENVRWAAQSTEASNWHPLTWISHMVDCQLFGLQPWGHHLTSVLLHALNTLLLFLALRRMTGAPGRSWFVAALFGLHPLHVESVAWIAERKDVLSTTFWMLVLWAYARRAAAVSESARGPWFYYCLSLLFFALGLMCKPMLVTLPCVLLLLDFWPLRRWASVAPAARWRLAAEKIPFFALAAAASAITLFAQGHGETVGSVEDFPWPVRLANAVTSYGAYLGKCFLPVKLAVFYPFFAVAPPAGHIAWAGIVLVTVTAGSLALARPRPYLPVGWLWFGGTLLPVIGLVQVGGQAMADRYTYVPLIGIFIMLVWGAADLAARWSPPRYGLALAGSAVLAACTVLTTRQLEFWRDGTSLFRHALAVTENNWVAHANLSATLNRAGAPGAADEMRETMRIIASFAETHDHRGLELEQTPGQLPAAIAEFRTAVRIMRVLPLPHYNLGTALAQVPGGMPEAIEEFRAAIELQPAFVQAHYNLGLALAGTPDGLPGAMAEFETCLRLAPDSAAAHYNLGLILARLPGRADEAIGHFEAALKIQPGLAPAREMIARLRAPAR